MKTSEHTFKDGTLAKGFRIYNDFKYDPKLKKRDPNGVSLWAWCYGDKMALKHCSYYLENKSRPPVWCGRYIIISLHGGSCNIYKIRNEGGRGQKGIHNISPYSRALVQNTFKRSIPNSRHNIAENCHESNRNGIRALRHFLKENNHPLKIRSLDEHPADIIFNLCYPSLGYFRIYPISMSPVYSSMLKKLSPKEIVHQATGSNGKAIRKAVYGSIESTKSYDALSMLLLTKKLIPIDDSRELVDFFSESFKSNDPPPRSFGGIATATAPVKLLFPYFRRNLKKYNRRIIKSIIRTNGGLVDFSHYIYPDIYRMHAEFPDIDWPDNPRSFREIHNFYVERRNRRWRENRLVTDKKREEEFEEPFEYEEDISLLHTATVNDMQLALPQNPSELQDWGAALHQCVGSYWPRVKSRETTIIGVYKENKLKYNVELAYGRVNQFYGPCNEAPEELDKYAVVEFLQEKGIV